MNGVRFFLFFLLVFSLNLFSQNSSREVDFSGRESGRQSIVSKEDSGTAVEKEFSSNNLSEKAERELAEVIFVLDMSWQELAGNFEPNLDYVEIAADFNSWNGSGALLEMGEGIYEYTIELEVGVIYEYKYRINGSWDTAELSDEDNRVLEVPVNGTLLNDIYDNWLPEISWVDLIYPLEISVPVNQQTQSIYGQIYIEGLTENFGAAPLVEAQVGYGTGLPDEWFWQTAMYFQEISNNDEYSGTLSSSSPGTYYFGYRFRFNLGQWHYGTSFGNLIVLPDELPDLVINEINFTCAEFIGLEADYEFIELYNPNTFTVDLGYYVINGSVCYNFSAGTMIAAEGYLVIAGNPDELMQAYNLDNVVGPFSGSLPNDSGIVILQTAGQREIIDQVDYEGNWYFLAGNGYSSLELRNPNLDNSQEDSWCASTGSSYDEELTHYGGTPGVMNLHYYTIYDIQWSTNNSSKKEHEMVQTTGIITAKFFGANTQRYAMQVPEFLMNTYNFSGIFVYANGMENFELGDIITVTGIVTEDGAGYSDTVLDPWNISLQSSGNQLPEPHYIDLIEADAMTEDWEAVLITTSGNCSTYNPNGAFWAITDGMWSGWIAGISDQHYSVPEGAITVGNDYTVRGIIEGFDIWLRSADDWNEGLYTLPGSLLGTVTSANTGHGVQGALITAAHPESRTEYTTTTDAAGEYEMEIPVGMYHVTCLANGYEQPEYEFVIVDEEEIEVINFVLQANNLPPVLNLPGIFSFNEDESLTIDINDYATDPENDPLSAWVEGNNVIQVVAMGSELTFNAPVNWNGMESVTIYVSDEANRNVVSEVQDIEVYPVNDPPWLELPEELTINIAIDEIPYVFDIEFLCYDVDGDQLWAGVIYDPDIEVMVNGLVLEITPAAGFTGSSELTVTVYDNELQAVDMVIVNVIDESGSAELVFDIFELEAGPAGINWMFDADTTPFDFDGNENSNYAYQAFNWNLDGHGDGSCLSGGSGVVTDQICISENLPFVDSVNDLGVYINGYALTFFEHINTENPGQPWDTMGEAGDHRQYTGGTGEISHNGNVVLFVNDVLYDMTVFYPSPIGNGGAMGYGTVDGEGVIDVENSHPQWVEYFDPDGTGLIYFSCDSMSPVLQDCYGTYNVDNLVIYGTEAGNQPPLLSLPYQFAFDEDSSLQIDLNDYAFDPDGDELSVFVQNNQLINALIEGTLLTLSAEANWNGMELITIGVDDGQNRAIASVEVEIVVNPVNDAPWIDLPDEITIDTGIDPLPYEFDLADYCGDIDGDELSFSVMSSPEIYVNFDQTVLLIDVMEMIPVTASITITVFDPLLLEASDNMNINILANTPTAVHGWVNDEDNFIPLENVEITLTESARHRLSRYELTNRPNYTVYTDQNGFYQLELEPGFYNLIATLPDYDPFQDFDIYIEENVDLEYSFFMLPCITGYQTTGLYTTGCSWGDGLIDFSLADIINTGSGCSNDETGYGDFTSMTAVVQISQLLEITAATGYDNNYLKVWVDFNNDFAFDEEDELIAGPFNLAAANTQYQIAVIIPATAQEGSYRLRARAVWNTTDFTAVSLEDYGEVEDYTLVVESAPVLMIDLPDEGIEFDEDTLSVLELADYITGSDYSISCSGNEFISVIIYGTQAEFTPMADWNGSESITFTVSDETSRTTVSDDLVVTISPVNDTPWIELPTQIPFYTYGPKVRDLSSYFGDVDGDILNLTVTGNDSIGVEVLGSIIHLLIEDGWTGTETWTITVDDGVTRTTAYDIVNIQVGDVLIINLDNVLPTEEYGTGCFNFSEDGAELSVIPPAGEGWECNGSNDPSWFYYPGELSLTPGRLYVNLDYFDLHWFQVDVTLTDYCGIGCTEVTATMGQNTFMTNYNTESSIETHVTIVNGMGNDYDGFYISTWEGVVHEIHVYFADQNPTYIGGHITDSITELPLPGVEITVADVFDPTIVYTTGTGSDGNYYVEVEPSTYDISFECEGYENVYYYNVTLAEGEFIDYSFYMTPEIEEISLSRMLTSGWNWISLNLECSDMEINAIFSSLGECGINVKNQNSFAIYYAGAGWIGSMTSFELSSLYKLQMNDPAPWEISGAPVQISEFPINLYAGWNWISFLPQIPMEINTALDAVSANAVNIKNSNYFATYYPGSGWFGSLSELSPLYGYMLQMNTDDVLLYPDDVVRNSGVTEVPTLICNIPEWQLKRTDFEFNGSIVAHLEEMETGDLLAAFSGEDCRGIGEVLDYSEIFGTLTFALMAYTNESNGEILNFRFYDESENKVHILTETLQFSPDDVIGGFDKPLQFTIATESQNVTTPTTALIRCVPNPFNPCGSIYYSLTDPSFIEISIYNIRGQKVKSLVNEYHNPGEYKAFWNGDQDNGNSAASGIYFVKMIAEESQDTYKVILLK